jgi:hypothetical protein
VDPKVEQLVLQLLEDNPTWGSNKVVGALKNLGYTISDVTIDNIRQRNAIDPAPERGKNTSWDTFIQAHREGLIAADFFTTEVVTWRGLITCYTLVVIDLPSRLVYVCGTTVAPTGEWMLQIARKLTDGVSGFARDKRHLLLDWDT